MVSFRLAKSQVPFDSVRPLQRGVRNPVFACVSTSGVNSHELNRIAFRHGQKSSCESSFSRTVASATHRDFL